MNMRLNHCIASHSGFTLVEILIGVTLLGFILLLVFSSLHTAGKSWTSSAQQIEQSEELRLASRFIQQSLSQAVPLLWFNAAGKRIAFKGQSGEIHFATALPAHRGGGGLYLLTVKLSEVKNNQPLVLHYRAALPELQSFDILSQDQVATTVLAENVKKLEFSYFGNKKPQERPQWHSAWEVEDRLPRLVRLQISFHSPQPAWPELLIPIYSQVETGQPQFQQFAAAEAAEF